MDKTKNSIELWNAFQQGDRDAFQQIYFNVFDSLFEYGSRLVKDEELVKDAIHDLFVKIWNNRANLSMVKAVNSYLLVALRGAIYNMLNKNKRTQLFEEAALLPFEMEFSAESKYINKETNTIQSQKLIEALNQLTPRQKEVIYLRYYEEMSYEEIAVALNITIKATYKLSARGLVTLRQILNISVPSVVLLLLMMREKVF